MPMADENGEKTEAPTPRRRQKAEEQGQIARSQDLVGAALIVGAMYLLNHYGQGVLLAIRTFLVESLESLSVVETASPVEALGRGVIMSARALMPLLVGLLLIALVGNIAQ